MVTVSDLQSSGRGFDSRSGRLSSNNSRQVVHTHVPLSPSSIGLIWYRPSGGDALQLGRKPYVCRRIGNAPDT